MSVLHTPRKPEIDARTLVIPLACGVFLLVLFFRLWYFQVVLSSELTERAAVSGKSAKSKLAPRGLIYDRNNRLIAGVQPEIVITGIPVVMKKHPEILDRLATLLGTPRKKLEGKLKKGVNPQIAVPIFVGASIQVATEIAESGDDLPGVGVDTQPMRFYPDTLDLTHILGNVWVPSPSDVKRLHASDVEPAEYVGKFGIEWFYEQQLMGRPGSEDIELDAKRRPLRVVSRDNPVPGSQLVLSVDLALQKLAREALNGRKGAVVAIDPTTGEVLCLASNPTFDLALFQGGISFENFAALRDDEDQPFENRAMNGFYAPGSTFKIVTSLAMEETGKFDPNATVYCDGAFHITKKAKLKCLGVHGAISYKNAFEKSCNTYFATMGTEVGADALDKAATELGLGDRTGIDLASELKGGVVPNAAYKEKHFHERWYTGDTANTAIGQGYVAVSPLQMADLVAMVANRGTMYRPHLVHGIRESGATALQLTKPEVIHSITAPDQFWDQLLEALTGVIKEGTAQNCQIPGLVWGGKTGSAEHKRADKTHSWFVGLAPIDHPRIAIAVVVESAGHGSDIAAPIARDIVRAYLFPPKAAKPVLAAVKSATAASTPAGSPGGVSR